MAGDHPPVPADPTPMSSRRFPTTALAILLVLQAVTVVGIVTLSSVSTRDALVDQLQGTLTLVSRDTTDQTEAYLQRAATTAQVTADALEQGLVPSADRTRLEEYLRLLVTSEPDLAATYVGFPDGSFVYAGRDGALAAEEGGTRSKLVTIGPDGRTVEEVERDGDGAVLQVTPLPDDEFDPRGRPWYLDADPDEVHWTDPYVFFASGHPGVTASRAVVGPDGEVVAVVGVDLLLASLSDFVAGLEVTDRSEVVIVGGGGGVVAFDEVEAVTVDDDGELRQATVEELGVPALVAATEALTDAPEGAALDLEAGRPVLRGFELDGTPWQVALTTLPEEPRWLVAVTAPESDIVGGILDAQRRNVLLAVAVGLGVVALAIPVVRLIGRRLERVQRRADTDPLTGLPNRRRFDELVAEAAAGDGQACVAVIDVDEFKAVNDTYGHGVGDEALQTVAGRVRHALRDTDVVGRVGGDEFAALLVGADLDLAADVMERARRALADEPANTAEGPVPVTVTVGVARLDGEAVEGAMADADAALYAAKAAGRNRVATPRGIHTPAG